MNAFEFRQKFLNGLDMVDPAVTPVVVMIGSLPHTVKNIRVESDYDMGYTIWIDAEES